MLKISIFISQTLLIEQGKKISFFSFIKEIRFSYFIRKLYNLVTEVRLLNFTKFHNL